MLPGARIGFYGCSKLGLTLLETPADQSGTALKICSGMLVSVPVPTKAPPVDGKSGAARIALDTKY
jgi:hypothetical protein